MLSSKNRWIGYWFIAPAVVTLLLLVTYPLLYGAYISFFDTNLTTKWDFVGLKYYKEIFSNTEFIGKILLTLHYTFWVVAGHFVVGMGLALILNMKLKGQTVFRVILILPWLFPEVVVGLLWKWLFNPLYGLFNAVLMGTGMIDEPISWLGNEQIAFIAVIIVSIWKGFPMVMMLILAGLQNISEDIYEAAKIDGCTRLTAFRYVTLPGLMPVMLVTLILDTVWWFKQFTMIWILTQGGPGNATNVVSIDIFKQAFDYFVFGKASAMAIIVFFVCYLMGYGYRRLFGNGND
ncbi:Inner membrane ABC transporter permease protein YcjO [Paenibacillus sp. CECT 9249]|uniref:carbohydrate ABC transporter permease n=1 Tax=Paenibacillus sp. CECT 9249 TaxID=2845385 RepID=UPI001E469246|nr:sugar ABC transporter permease [Paenibacillus sp. CECT 9249]CAH0122470.1 Inner membrane ABC transporter permease protein YcjO [Paenibacillus sp. CECT 9249]